MATPKENLLSLGHLTDTFTKQRQHRLKKSVNTPMLFQADFSAPQSHQHLRKMHLQQRLQELKERELTAQQHNRRLLQQFDEAQDTLREMLTLTANMKTIRVEYERYLEESAPRWQQQLKEQTQAAQRKRMEEFLKSCLRHAEDQVINSSADRPLLSQGPTTKPQKTAPPQQHYSQNSPLDYTQDGSPHLPYMQPSWQTHPHTQTSGFPIRAPHQPQGSSHVPPSFLPPPVFSHPFQLGHHPPWPRQNPTQPDWSWTAGIPSGSEALWGQLYTEEPPPEREVVQVAREEGETSRAPSSKREKGGGSRSSLLSQELDVKPVRLSGSPAESSESSRESSQASREKREKRERSWRPSSDRERCSSQESSRSSSAIVTAAVTVAKSSKSDASSEKSRTSGRGRRSAGLAVGSPTAENVVKERSRSNGDDSESPKEESQSIGEESRSEEAGDRSPDAKSLSGREESGSQKEEEEESGSVSVKIEKGGGGQSSSSEESSEGEKEEEAQDKDLGDGDEDEDDGEEKEESQRDEEQEVKDVEEEEEEMKEQESEEEGDEEEKSDRLKNEENGEEGSVDEEDEEEGEGEEDKIEEEGESDEEEEEEQGGDEAGEPEERDSEDSIISPQSKPKKMHIIPEEAGEDEEEDEDDEGITGSSDSNENSDEDIENLLAPQEQSQKKEEKNLKADETPKETCDRVQIFQVETSPKRDHQSDSEEFDQFYD